MTEIYKVREFYLTDADYEPVRQRSPFILTIFAKVWPGSPGRMNPPGKAYPPEGPELEYSGVELEYPTRDHESNQIVYNTTRVPPPELSLMIDMIVEEEMEDDDGWETYE